MTGTAYISNTDVGDRFFDGETVPGDNTIKSSQNTSFINTTTNLINGRIFKSATSTTDTYGILKELALEIYERLLDGVQPALDIGTPDKPGVHWGIVQDIINAYDEAPFGLLDAVDGDGLLED